MWTAVRHNLVLMEKGYAPARVVHVSADASTGKQSQKWEKVLWKEQDFPDNYTDGSFLRSLEVNAQVTDRDYWKLVLGASAITQQLSTVAFVVSVSVYLYEASICLVLALQCLTRKGLLVTLQTAGWYC